MAYGYHFALVTGGSSFFDPITQGFIDKCQELARLVDFKPVGDDLVTCEVHVENWTWFEEMGYTKEEDIQPCVPQLRLLMEQTNPKVDAIATKCNLDPTTDSINILQELYDSNIPTIVHAGPHIGPYLSYVGTNNTEVGRAMARLLKQLRPEGGTYFSTYNEASAKERHLGFVDEISKDNNRDDKGHWYPLQLNFTEPTWIESGFTGMGGHASIREKRMELIASLNPTAFMFMYQSPMRIDNYTAFIDRNRWRNITYIGTEGTGEEFLGYMSRKYVDGLIGQVTYDQGYYSAETLHNIVTSDRDWKSTIHISKTSYDEYDIPKITIIDPIVDPIINTKLINYNLVPDQLPPLDFDQNLLGNLRYVGFVCFGIVTFTVIVCITWSINKRNGMIVKASQPFFLVMTATGVFVMCCALIPLSFDDNGVDTDELSNTKKVGICMSIPWLAFIGFTITFAALFSKTWRVNQFFNSKNAHDRIRVSERDVLGPFMVLLSSNIIVLICWTMLDPLTYIRQYEDGTDLWNREIASNGSCRSENAMAYLIPLGLSKFLSTGQMDTKIVLLLFTLTPPFSSSL